MSPGRRTVVAALVGAVVAGRLQPARADVRPPRTAGLRRLGPALAVSVGARDLFTAADDERLRSGFASRVLIRVELLREGVRGPGQTVYATARTSEITYDLWDERFRVQTWDGRAAAPHIVDTKSVDEAIRAATELHRFPVAPLAALAPGARYRLRFRVDLNPISEAAAGEVRRWLLRPPNPSGATGAGDSVFGSFVSIFVNPQIDDSERQIVFLSQAFGALPEGGGR